jgi:hypothetical protein
MTSEPELLLRWRRLDAPAERAGRTVNERRNGEGNGEGNGEEEAEAWASLAGGTSFPLRRM